MSISEIVNVTVTVQAQPLERAGFGTPLIAGFHNVWPDRVRTYTGPDGMVADGFPATHPLVRQATVLKSQSPTVPSFKVGRRALAHTQVLVFVPQDLTEGVINRIDVTDMAGTVTSATHTNGPAETVASIITAMVPQLTAVTGMTAVDTGPGTSITCTADTAGDLFDYSAISNMSVENTTVDPGIATDLAAIRLADEEWYGLLLDSNGAAEISAAGAWAEARTLLFLADSADTGILDSGTTTDIASALQTAGYNRTACLFNSEVLSYASAGWMGLLFTYDPGVATWAFKAIAGITIDDLNANERASVEGKNATHTQALAGRRITRFGTAASGLFLDVTRLADFLGARIGEDIFAVLSSEAKVPYTDAGIDLITAQVRGVLQAGVDAGTIAKDPAYRVTAPRAADVSPTDRANRLLPDVKAEARITGAVHKVNVTLNLAA